MIQLSSPLNGERIYWLVTGIAVGTGDWLFVTCLLGFVALNAHVRRQHGRVSAPSDS